MLEINKEQLLAFDDVNRARILKYISLGLIKYIKEQPMSNKKARKKLIKLYGAECFIEKLHLRKDTELRQYTGKGK